MSVEIGMDSTWSLKFLAALDKQAQALRVQQKQLSALAQAAYGAPNIKQQGGATVAAGATTAFIDLGYPSAGLYWVLRRVTVSGNDATSPIAGANVFLFVGQPNFLQVGNTTGSGLSYISGAAGLPAQCYFGSDEMTVNAGEHVMVYVTGLTAGTAIAASLGARQFIRFSHTDLETSPEEEDLDHE
jgi:hypothetical protein